MASSFIKIGFMTASLMLSLSSTTSFAKEYYKWVDAKGSTHYSTTPPPKSAKKKGKVDTYGSSHSSSNMAHENNSVKEQPAQNTTSLTGDKATAVPNQNNQGKPSTSATQQKL